MAILVNMRSLSRLVERAAAGEDIVMRLPKEHAKLPWNVFKGKIEIAKDFDAPLPEFKDSL
jgi:hypothetical protein